MLDSLEYAKVSDPSLFASKDVFVVSFQASSGDAALPADAMLIFLDTHTSGRRIMKLSEHLRKEFGIEHCTQVRLFGSSSEVFLTFRADTSQHLCLMQVYPEIHRPLLCEYPDAKKHDPNWAFFCRHKQFYAYASIDPPVLLKAGDRQENEGRLLFDRITGKEDGTVSRYSIGTHVIEEDGDQYVMVQGSAAPAGRSISLVRVVRMQLDEKMQPTVSLGRPLFIESIWSLIGSSMKFRGPALRAPCVTGFVALRRTFLLSYRIDQDAYGFAELRKNVVKE